MGISCGCDTGREKDLQFNHREWLAQGTLLPERREAAALPDSIPALGAGLQLITQLLETLECASSPLPREL